MAILCMLRGYRSSYHAMLVACDENKTFHSNFELPQLVIVVEQLQLHFNSLEPEPLAGHKLVRCDRF